jgi:lysozyme family protein/V8-like Glu-specific endopeptidase
MSGRAEAAGDSEVSALEASTAAGFEDVAGEYRQLWANCTLRGDRLAAVDSALRQITRAENRAHYDAAAALSAVPWWFVAALHMRESGLRFTRHLHNGDPLTKPTVHVPKGRPQGWGPFSWEDSAADALDYDGLSGQADWGVAQAAYRFERFNGFGYRKYHPAVKSPYLWSFSEHYAVGKYGADGRFDANLTDAQCGTMVLLKRMAQLQLIRLDEGSAELTVGIENILDPGLVPAWQEVSPTSIEDAPYAAVGRVRVLRGSEEVTRGTCWLAGNNTAVTAAHVIEQWGKPRVKIEVTLPGQGQLLQAVDALIPENYGQSTGPYDPWDVGLIRLKPGTRSQLGRVASAGATAQVLGFPFGGQATMVESRGQVRTPDSTVLLHRADTVPGHSGGPVMQPANGMAQRVIALHISGFEGNPYKVQHPKHNVALMLRPEVETLIGKGVADWG